MEKENFNEDESLSSQNDSDTVVKHNYSALEVANAFVKQYYKIMQSLPTEAHNFYKEQSIRSHTCVDGSMKSVTTLKDIDDEIMASNIKEWNPDLRTMHAQDSVIGSVVVGVSGSLIDNADVARNFAQTFVLAPQEGGGFYVHNDILQFLEIIKTLETSPTLDDVANPLTDLQADDTDDSLKTAQATNKDQTDKSSKKEDDFIKNKVAESSEGKNILPTEAKNKSQPSVWHQAPNMQDEAKKLSYASILAKEGSVVKDFAKMEKKTSVSPAASKPSVFPVRSSTTPNNGPLDNIYDVKAIRVKDLPPKITQESILEVVKQFGPVKLKNIQIKEYSEDGYRYAFVEFDNAKSARNALEARFVRFGDKESEIQHKKLPNQGGHNNMVTPPIGRGGFRNDNFWSRDGEGRSNGNWGHKHNEQRENSGQYSGQTNDYNYRRNRYSQDH